ncbi:MAG: hypothetical protein IJ877_01005 [Candidatus Gastranaerophilales bacterium]|nr:hypothetical protein [Candidatus Gastranaerophilales bacterium]
MGLSASQGRMLLLTARKSDLEFRAQQISQRRLILSQQLEEIAMEYEEATSNRQMKINLYQAGSDPSDGLNRTTNLTYAALVSGTLKNMLPEESGIREYDRTSDQEYVSNTPYRLTDAYGAIIVSSVDEIPVSTKTSLNVPEHYSDGKTETALYQALKNTEGTPTIEYDEVNRMLKIGDRIFLANGAEATEAANKNKFQATGTTILTTNKSTQDSSLSYSLTNTRTIEPQKGGDNKYNLVDVDGTVLARYIVDESLKYGNTDASGNTDGPNYLQDCLRNGKYLLQKASINTETGKYQWKSLSWDATANIQDNYYAEDDDKAKAKYDRLQNQIQAQDKKLELELDNIETQRSAVTTEIESVQKVIDDNVQDSFKIFNA